MIGEDDIRFRGAARLNSDWFVFFYLASVTHISICPKRKKHDPDHAAGNRL